MKKILITLIICICVANTQAQISRYIVKFKNKGTNPYTIATPSNYLSARAIARRSNFGITIDSTDLPITPRYIDSVRLAGAVTILNASKWLNQVSIQTTDAAAIAKIKTFAFVDSVNNIAARFANTTNTKPVNKFDIEKTILPSNNVKTTSTQDFYSYGNTYNEIHLHNGEFLHNIGLRGQGMLVAVLDAGFYHYTTLKSFDSVNANNQVIQTWDFVAREASVIEDDTHGMSCFSAIAGNIPGTFVGNAPKANFALYRTEDAPTEYPIEEHNWVCGMEKADSIGADITSVSLGYTTFDDASFDHTYADMIGSKTIAAKGAKIANRKGMLSFIAMGNDGNNSWHYLSTPADTDSVVAVGAVTAAGVVGSFSSYGPSYDGRVKPEASAPGVSVYVQNANNTIGTGNGTSYATPKLAGLGTCLWQGFPEQKAQTIRTAIINAGNKFLTPDNRYGYGVPDMKKAFIFLLNKYAKINSATNSNCKTVLAWQSKDVSIMKYEIERMTAAQTSYTKIGEVQGTGTILGNKTYSYSDSLINVQAGTVKYRIKQIIDTNTVGFTATYIDSATINLTNACIATAINPVNINGDKISIIPNPVVSNSFTLKVETNYAVKNLLIAITDIKGRLVQKLEKTKNTGIAAYTINTNTLAKGEYIITLYNDKKLIGSQNFIRL